MLIIGNCFIPRLGCKRVSIISISQPSLTPEALRNKTVSDKTSVIMDQGREPLHMASTQDGAPQYSTGMRAYNLLIVHAIGRE